MSKTKLTASEWELVKNAHYWVNRALTEADGRAPFFVRLPQTTRPVGTAEDGTNAVCAFSPVRDDRH